MKWILAAILITTIQATAQLKIDRDRFISLLKQKKYGLVFNEAMTLREKVYGKCLILDYFIAKSLCLDNYTVKGREWLDFILSYYPLSNKDRRFIENERENCRDRVRNISLPTTIYSWPIPEAGVYASLKGDRSYDCETQDRVIKFNNKFSENDLLNRLFEIDKKDSAVLKTRSLLNDNYKVTVNNRYVFVSMKSEDISDDDIGLVAAKLEKAYNFFVSYYGLRAPDKLITVYLLPDKASLRKTAKLVHDAELPKNILGYSLLTDLSLLGVAEPDAVGTLYHELFHLIVRTDIGDIPAWLDEGMASLYSISRWDSGILYGDKDTWRIDQLRRSYLSETSQVVPKLADLLAYNWQQFNGGEDVDLCKASVHYSLANFLLLFLQDQNKLQSLITAYKTRATPGDSLTPSRQSDIQTLEQTLGYSTDSLQSKFAIWFKQEFMFNPFAVENQEDTRLDYEDGDISYPAARYTARRLLTDLEKRSLPAEEKLGRLKRRFAGIEKKYRRLEKKLEGSEKRGRRSEADADDEDMQRNTNNRKRASIKTPVDGDTTTKKTERPPSYQDEKPEPGRVKQDTDKPGADQDIKSSKQDEKPEYKNVDQDNQDKRAAERVRNKRERLYEEELKLGKMMRELRDELLQLWEEYGPKKAAR